MRDRSSRRGPRRQLIRKSDGTLHDLTTEQDVTASELRDFISAGGYFEARRQDGTECTMQVLTEVLQEAVSSRRRHRRSDPRAPSGMPAPWGPWSTPGPTGPLGPLQAVLGVAPSPAALEPLAQMLSLWGAWRSRGTASGRRAPRRREGGSPPRKAPSRASRQRSGGEDAP